MNEPKHSYFRRLCGVELFLGSLLLINLALLGYVLYRHWSDRVVSTVPVGRLVSVTYHSRFFRDETAVATDEGGFFLVDRVFPGFRGHALQLQTFKYGNQALCDPALHVCAPLAR